MRCERYPLIDDTEPSALMRITRVESILESVALISASAISEKEVERASASVARGATTVTDEIPGRRGDLGRDEDRGFGPERRSLPFKKFTSRYLICRC